MLLEFINLPNQFRYAWLTPGGILGKCFEADHLQWRRDMAIGIPAAWFFRLIVNNLVKRTVDVFSHEGYIKAEYFIQDDACRIDIGSLVNIMTANRLFR